MRLLHISMNNTHSECKPSSSISSFTHSLQVFLLLPAHLTPVTYNHIPTGRHPISTLIRSTCPHHLNLPRLTTSATLSTTKDCTNPHTRHPAQPFHHHPFRTLISNVWENQNFLPPMPAASQIVRVWVYYIAVDS